MNLLSERARNGRRWQASSTLESGDQVHVTLAVSGPQLPGEVTVTKVFTFRSGTNVVVRINDGVDVLALRARRDQAEGE